MTCVDIVPTHRIMRLCHHSLVILLQAVFKNWNGDYDVISMFDYFFTSLQWF